LKEEQKIDEETDGSKLSDIVPDAEVYEEFKLEFNKKEKLRLEL